jgi:putative FmdB family regulatory protein
MAFTTLHRQVLRKRYTRGAKKEDAMPTYSFECRRCKKKFQEILSYSEYEAGKRKCPKCGSKDVIQVLETFYAKTSRKS